jgi:2-polyprenyl-3-methyl-5-hydroxy-6-metoxy-1,4-benzoquinol methylase
MNDSLKCPVCACPEIGHSRQEYTDQISKILYQRYRCNQCDVEFWTPLAMPSASYYENFAAEYDEFHQAGEKPLKWWHKTFYKTFPKTAIPGTMLDIGCADGRFLKHMKTLGWQIYGLDIDSKSVNIARNHCETERIFNYNVEEFIQHYPELKFDLVTFFEVMEHQTDPQEFIRCVKKLLRPNGFIAGSVPNRNRYIVDVRFSPDIPPHHFTLWSKKTLLEFFKRNDITSVEFRQTRYEPIILNQLIMRLFYTKINKFKSDLGIYSLENPGKLLNRQSLKITFLSLGKRYIWNVVVRIASIVEYPIIFFNKMSISLYFQARVDN